VIPIRDENPTGSPPHVTRAIIIINVIVFFVLLFSGSLEGAINDYGMIPALIMDGRRLFTLLSSMFLHGGIIHLAGNMLYLYVFGDNVEYSFGHKTYLAFYLLCGIAAGVAHILATDPASWNIPTIGASGAISGVLGAYLFLYPRARIVTLVFVRFIYFVRVPAVVFLGFWFFYQFLTPILEPMSSVAYWAHIGGFLAGMALAPLLRRRGVRRVASRPSYYV